MLSNVHMLMDQTGNGNKFSQIASPTNKGEIKGFKPESLALMKANLLERKLERERE